ncbi:12297_t:CDS:2, partial [Gigaspora margarita]
TRDGKKKSRLDKLIVELGKWVRKGKKKIESDITEEDRKFLGYLERISENRRQEHKGLEQICIERRYQIIDEEQGRTIASLLEKPFNHTVVDKLLENQNNTRVLICDSGK